MHIELHIEELVLHGFHPADRHRIGDAVERELARLIADQGMNLTTARSVAIERLDGGAIPVAANAGPEAVGAKVARALYAGIPK